MFERHQANDATLPVDRPPGAAVGAPPTISAGVRQRLLIFIVAYQAETTIRDVLSRIPIRSKSNATRKFSSSTMLQAIGRLSRAKRSGGSGSFPFP